MANSNALLRLLLQLGFFDLLRGLKPNMLTVLNYHRIDDPSRTGFNTFKPNVSATPSQFAQQMNYLSQNYNVISGRQVAEWVRGDHQLPSNAAVITFDDGYYDNLQYAYPILKAHGFPAVIFLTTDFIDTSTPFYWDVVAYCFDNTPKSSADLPLLGSRHWQNVGERKKVMDEWIALLKTLPEVDKKKQVDQLPKLFNVSIPDDLSACLALTWSDVRYLSENGVEMGSHTVNHPILTRISLDDVQIELEKSKKVIEGETKLPVSSFAYPNGQRSDFNDAIMKCVRTAGYEIAFTLLPGPTRYGSVKRSPFAIRRIFLSYRDTFPRFVGKLTGMSRLRS